MNSPYFSLTTILVLFSLEGGAAEGLVQGIRALRVATFAGLGKAGYSGDGGPAAQARLDNPFGVVRGPDGALYVCDVLNHVIRRIAADGTISTVAGSGKAGYWGDGGPALEAGLNEPYEVRFDAARNLFFVERLNHVVRRVDAHNGAISTVAGTGRAGFSGDGGLATQAELNQPHSIQFDGNGDLFICDIANHRVRKVDMKTGIITTFGGTGERASPTDGAPLKGAPLNGPRAIDFDQAGNLWLALREGNTVYMIDMRTMRIHHMAGTGARGFTGNGGPAKQATLSGPKGISVAPNGNVYLADTESHSIRMIDVGSGRIELIAGTGKPGDGPDGDPSQCHLARPHGVFVDADGSVFVGDSENHRVRVIRGGSIVSPSRSETPDRAERSTGREPVEAGAGSRPPKQERTMPKVSKFTKEQKLEIALELISGRLSHGEVCRKHGISATYAYKLKDRALELLRQGIDQGMQRPNGRE